MNVQYAAGLIDGEGWIGITSRSRGESYEVNLKVSMSDKGRPALDALASLLGGKVIPDRDATDVRRSTWRWQLTGKAATAALRILQPHLLVKALPCQIALELSSMVEAAAVGRGGGKKWTPEMSERASMLKSRIQEANRRGPDPEPEAMPSQKPLAIYRHGWWWEPEDDLFGPVEFQGKWPTCGRMAGGHVYATSPWEQRMDASASSSSRNLPTPTSRDWKDSEIRREPHRPDDTDTLSRALADLI